MKRAWLIVGFLMSAALSVSCGGGSSPANKPFTPAGSTSLSFTIRDTPPSGVSVLSFEITVTGAVLHQGTTNVSILSAPVKVEITQLETESAFLSTQGVAPGQYDSITVTFANPEMTILNNSGNRLPNCEVGAICELEPGLNPASVDFSGNPPFPLNLTADTATGLLLDFNLDASVQNDLSIQPTIGFTQLPVVQNAGELEDLEDLSGQITAVGNNQFTLQAAGSGQSLVILVDSNTQFEDFGEAGLTNAFSSLMTGQAVEVDVRLNGSGSMLAKKVELREVEQEEDLEGTIVSVDVGLTKFDMVVLEEVHDSLGVEVGNKVTVTLDGANFRPDDDGLNVSGFQFATSADLSPGQTVDVRPVSGSSGTSIITNRVRLRMSQFTAQVRSTSGSIIIVDNLPGVFTAAGITEIEVRTDSQTNFDDVSGVGALVAGDRLALRGLLFKTAGTPALVLVAKKVRKL